jgi:methyl-accepting chemotaxis protein
MKLVNEGNLNIAFEDKKRDEMGTLSSSFNQTIGTTATANSVSRIVSLNYVTSVHSASKNMVDSKEKTLQAIEVIASVAQETAAVTEEAYANSEDQLVETEKLANMAQDLSQTSSELSDAILKFKVS